MYHPLRCLISFVLVLALSWLQAPTLVPAIARNNPIKNHTNHVKGKAPSAGRLLAVGSASINGQKAVTGATVFNESRIDVTCAAGNSVTVDLGRLGRVEISPGAEMVVRFSESSIGGELLSGEAMISSAAGVKVVINTPEGVRAFNGQESSVLSAAAQGGPHCTPMTNAFAGSVPMLGAGALAGLLIGAEGAIVTPVGLSLKDRSASVPLP
jgi:hypothetical protein